MRGWRELALGEVLTLQRGFDLPARERVDGPHPIVSSSGVTGCHAVPKVDPPGVVIGRYGSLGQVHWVTKAFWPLNTALWVKDFKGNDPRFVSYLLGTVRMDGAAAAAVPGVNRNHLHGLAVRVPAVALQRRIVSILAAFDEIIEINERRIELLHGIARELHREWFVRYRFPGHEAYPANGSVPSGWEVHRLEDVANINACTARRADLPNPLRYLDISAVAPRRIRETQTMPASGAPGRARRRVHDGDTIWAMVRPNRRAHAIVHSPSSDMIVSTGFAVLTPARVPSAFLFEHTSSPEFTEHLTSRATGAAYPAVRPGDFSAARIVIPPSDLLARFAEVADPALRQASVLDDANRALVRTRDLLHPRLVTGRLDTSGVDLGDLRPEEDIA